jgi:hypothetical protein
MGAIKKPKTFQGQVFKIILHQLSKHDSSANFTIKTSDDSIKNIHTSWIDDLIKQLQRIKRELKKKHTFVEIEGEKYYLMKEKPWKETKKNNHQK